VLADVTGFTRDAQDLLRDPSHFNWYIATLLVVVLYVYANEVERRRWDVVFAGLAFWLADWINEIANSLVLHFSDRAALWTIDGGTAYLILIGLTVEISLMFAIAGVVYVKNLPPDRNERILGIPNRIAIALILSCFAVLFEVVVQGTGYWHWEYWWWNSPFVPLIVVFGYMWFFLVAAHVYDMGDTRRQARFVAAMAVVVATSLVVFGPILAWI
jgi:hypothetical protein